MFGNSIHDLDSLDFGTSLQSQIEDVHTLQFDLNELDGKTIDSRPFLNPSPFTVQETTPLTRVFRLYRSMGIRHLPVVSFGGEVMGMLSRKELRTDFTVDLN